MPPNPYTALSIAMSVAVALGCAKAPPPVPSMNSPLVKAATIHVARPKRKAGIGSQPWRMNVNGTDIGSLPYGSYCSFRVEDSALGFSTDAEPSAGQIATGIALIPVLLIGVFGLANVAADRYEPTEPQVIYVESGSTTYLRLEGGAPPLSLTETGAADWSALASGLEQRACSYP
jgi:hypothetical protein